MNITNKMTKCKDSLWNRRPEWSKDSLSETVFLILFFIYRIIGNFVTSDVRPPGTYVVPLLVALAGIYFCNSNKNAFLNRHPYPAGIACGIAAALLLFAVFPRLPAWRYYTCDLANMVLVSVSCYKRNYIKIVRTEAFVMFLFLLYRVPAALAGIIDSGVYTERAVIRSSLGTGHPNWISSNLFYLLLLLYVGRIVRSIYANLFLTICLFAFCETISHTRTTSLMCFLFAAILLADLVKQKGLFQKKPLSAVLRVTDLLAVFSFPINCVFWISLILAYPKGNAFIERLNGRMAGRLVLAYNLIQEYGISPTGSLLKDTVAGSTENQYASLLVRIGYAGLIVLSIVVLCIAFHYLRAGKRRLLYMSACLALYSGSEGGFLSPDSAIFFYLVLADLTAEAPAVQEFPEKDKNVWLHTVMLIPAAVFIFLIPALFTRMRTILPAVSYLYTEPRLRLRVFLSFVLAAAFLWLLAYLIRDHLIKRPPSRVRLITACVCAAVILFDVANGSRHIANIAPDVQPLIEEDATAIETVLQTKTGKLYADPFPALYRKQYPQIAVSALHGKDLARMKNATVITDISLDGGNTFRTQNFQYVPISESHAIYTNDAPVIAALQEAGFPVSPFFNRRIHVDLEACARDSYLVYEPSFPGIMIDQASRVEEERSNKIWTNYNRVYGGSYEVTFTCRLLWPAENAADESIILGVNYAHGGELAQQVITPADAGADAYITVTIPFSLSYSMHGSLVSFSVYGGNMRRLVVEDISFIRVG